MYAEEFVMALNHVSAEEMSDLEMKLMPEYNTGRMKEGVYIRNSARSVGGRTSAVASAGRQSMIDGPHKNMHSNLNLEFHRYGYRGIRRVGLVIALGED